jgi:hypothetical protein
MRNTHPDACRGERESEARQTFAESAVGDGLAEPLGHSIRVGGRHCRRDLRQAAQRYSTRPFACTSQHLLMYAYCMLCEAQALENLW